MIDDFNPLEDMNGNPYDLNDPFNFQGREEAEHEDLTSVITYNLTRRHAK